MGKIINNTKNFNEAAITDGNSQCTFAAGVPYMETFIKFIWHMYTTAPALSGKGPRGHSPLFRLSHNPPTILFIISWLMTVKCAQSSRTST